MSYTRLVYHIVFATKHRHAPPTEDQMQRMRCYLAGIIRNVKADLHTCNGPRDHVHLLVSLPPDMSVSDFVRLIKTNSSKWFHETFQTPFSWQDGYAAFTVSYSGLKDVLQYIQGQEAHHRTMSFEEELERFLRKHDVSFERTCP
ncbi:MAG TPA: IS200/IS605 family transposase [Phycisphaerales bacterium]|nr:IS200/IS605 family transposase [Phycisphaerales bacterium]